MVARIFPMAAAIIALLCLLLHSGHALNLAPFFTDDMNQHTLKDSERPKGLFLFTAVTIIQQFN